MEHVEPKVIVVDWTGDQLLDFVAAMVPPMMVESLLRSDPERRLGLMIGWLDALREYEPSHRLLDAESGVNMLDWRNLDHDFALKLMTVIDDVIADHYRHWAFRLQPDVVDEPIFPLGECEPPAVKPDGKGGFVVRDGNRRFPPPTN
jgi:hypothetical protein